LTLTEYFAGRFTARDKKNHGWKKLYSKKEKTDLPKKRRKNPQRDLVLRDGYGNNGFRKTTCETPGVKNPPEKRCSGSKTKEPHHLRRGVQYDSDRE